MPSLIISLIVHNNWPILEVICKCFHVSQTYMSRVKQFIHQMCFPQSVYSLTYQSTNTANILIHLIKFWLKCYPSLCLCASVVYHKHFCESPASPALADTMVEDETAPRTFLLAPCPTWLLSSRLSTEYGK